MIGAGMELFLVSRNLERVADLATNIGEDVVFLVEGKSIKHHAEDRGEAESHGMTRRTGAEPRAASPRSTSAPTRSGSSSPSTTPPPASPSSTS